jgi:NAD(P)-dependent dehydrogenase (short-subunit alcohol dehydrogenase family)
MSWYQGKHAIVTGGGSGIGVATAQVLRDKGARVTIVARGEERLAAAASRIDCQHQVADVASRERVSSAFDAAAEANGPVDILVNNAGLAEAMPFAKVSDAHWEQMLAVNLTGVFNCTRAVIPTMLERGSGTIVNVASTAGLTGYAYVAAYCAAKHGVIGLTRSLALEYATRGITVNAVCPGYTETDIVDNTIDRIVAATGRSREEARAELLRSNPQGRFVQADEVADTIIWLCRQRSMNGQAIAIAGGEIM